MSKRHDIIITYPTHVLKGRSRQRSDLIKHLLYLRKSRLPVSVCVLSLECTLDTCRKGVKGVPLTTESSVWMCVHVRARVYIQTCVYVSALVVGVVKGILGAKVVATGRGLDLLVISSHLCLGLPSQTETVRVPYWGSPVGLGGPGVNEQTLSPSVGQNPPRVRHHGGGSRSQGVEGVVCSQFTEERDLLSEPGNRKFPFSSSRCE